MDNNRAVEVVGVLISKASACDMLFKILNMSPPKTDTTKRQQKYYSV